VKLDSSRRHTPQQRLQRNATWGERAGDVFTSLPGREGLIRRRGRERRNGAHLEGNLWGARGRSSPQKMRIWKWRAPKRRKGKGQDERNNNNEEGTEREKRRRGRPGQKWAVAKRILRPKGGRGAHAPREEKNLEVSPINRGGGLFEQGFIYLHPYQKEGS